MVSEGAGPMDPKKIEDLRKLIQRLVGPTGAYVLMLHNGTATQVYVDGDGRIKMRGLLENGVEYLRSQIPLGLAPEKAPKS